MTNAESGEPNIDGGVPHKECRIHSTPMPTSEGAWYVDSVETRCQVNHELVAQIFSDPLKDQSFPTKEEAWRAGIEWGKANIDARY